MQDITHDPSTWPTGDKLWAIARAIALAEGANKEGDVPDRLNNPGDISDGMHTFGFEHHSGSDIAVFPSKLDGWWWLRNKLYNIFSGKSKVYSTRMTWREFAQKWAANSAPWVSTVTHELGVLPDSMLCAYFSITTGERGIREHKP